MAEERSRLGRGLAALIGDVGDETQAKTHTKAATTEPGKSERLGQKRVPVEFIHPNPRNPRRTFTEAELEELSASVKERGVIQPIVVRAAKEKNHYEIIAGERRWRAAQRANLHEVPIVVIDASDVQSLEFAIIENVQRADLNAIEEAAGYAALMEEFGHDQDDVAKIVGKSRSHVANTLRLLKLSEPIKQYVRLGKLTAGHARQLIGQPNAEEIAAEIVQKGLNVRQVEAMARKSGADQARDVRREARTSAKDPDTRAMEKRVSDLLGLQIEIEHKRGSKGGAVLIRYATLEQLEEVVRRLERG